MKNQFQQKTVHQTYENKPQSGPLKQISSSLNDKNLKSSNFENIKREQVPTYPQQSNKASLKTQTRNEMNELGLLDESDLLNDNAEDDEYLALIEINNINKINSMQTTSNNTIRTNAMKNNYEQEISSFNRNVQPIKRQSSYSERLNLNLENSNKKPKSYHSTNVNKNSITIINDDDDDLLLVNNALKFEKSTQVTVMPNIKIDRLIDLAKFKCCMSSSCTHIIKGFIKTLTAPLNKINMKWYQKCLISDGTAYLDCYIADTIITDFMELTCQQAKELFQKSRESKDPNLLKVYEEKMNSCSRRLAHISSLMHLKYDNQKSEYCVIKFEDVSEKYFDYLISMVKKFKT